MGGGGRYQYDDDDDDDDDDDEEEEVQEEEEQNWCNGATATRSRLCECRSPAVRSEARARGHPP